MNKPRIVLVLVMLLTFVTSSIALAEYPYSVPLYVGGTLEGQCLIYADDKCYVGTTWVRDLYDGCSHTVGPYNPVTKGYPTAYVTCSSVKGGNGGGGGEGESSPPPYYPKPSSPPSSSSGSGSSTGNERGSGNVHLSK